MKVLISTDTSCLISQDTFKNKEISVFPLNVIIDEVEYLDGVSINQEQLKEAMIQNKHIQTSTPPMGVVIEYFESLFKKGYDKIIHFTISSKLSSMFGLFTTVSKNYFDDKIIVIDSYGVSSVMLSQVFLAYDLVKQGAEIEEICKKIEQVKQDNEVYFIPENLTALKNGGRISPAIAMIGNKIGLKPVLSLKDGELVKDGMTRNMKKAFKEKFDLMVSKYNKEKYDYTLIEFGGKESSYDIIKQSLSELVGENNIVKGIIPINVCAHCGVGTIGIVVTPRVNGRSLKEFI